MKLPDFLKPGDTIAIVATARAISKTEINLAVKTIKNWGFKVVLGKNLFSKDRQFAGTDEQRASDMQEALDDEKVKAILCARGGYGTVRIIDSLNFDQFLQSPKWLVGYSDITVLHEHIHRNFEIASLHATMPINFSKNEEATKSLYTALSGGVIKYSIPKHKLNRPGNCSGEIIGGNLSILYSICGSRSDIDTKGKILFIEDLDEYLYHVDRMMMNLKRSGKLEGLKGLIVGGLSDMKDNAVPYGKTAEEIIFDAVKEYNYPVCFNFPAGHVDKNMAMYFGKMAQLTINLASCQLKYL